MSERRKPTVGSFFAMATLAILLGYVVSFLANCVIGNIGDGGLLSERHRELAGKVYLPMIWLLSRLGLWG